MNEIDDIYKRVVDDNVSTHEKLSQAQERYKQTRATIEELEARAEEEKNTIIYLTAQRDTLKNVQALIASKMKPREEQ